VNTLDLMTSMGALFGLMPEVILTITACIVFLVAGWRQSTPEDSRLAGWISLAGVVLSGAALSYLWLGGFTSAGVPHMVAMDPFRYAALGILLLAVGLTIGLSLGYMEREGLLAPEYYGLVLLAAVGMMLLAGAVDFVVLFLGLELMSVAAYVLASFNRRSQASAESGLKYFLIGAFASAFLLYGIALLYGATGSTNLVLIGVQLSSGSVSLMTALGLGMLLIGFAFKVSAVPFHMWAPDVYDGAPTPVTGLMATGIKAAAFLALIRVLMQGLAPIEALWQPVISTLAVLTMVVGNLVALSQRSIKRMLAYSSIAHAGYLLVAVWPGTRLGAAALLIYLLAYGITTLAAFGILAMLGRDGERDVTVDDITGLAKERPWMAFAMAICMLSLLGFPGTFGFIAKWMVLTSAVFEGQWLLAVVMVLASVVSAGYYLPVIMGMYMRDAEPGVDYSGLKVWGAGAGVVAVAIVGIILFGLWPPDLIDLSMESAAALFQRSLPVAIQ
jgi:NADH-quinone oxidoreductase subunit N